MPRILPPSTTNALLRSLGGRGTLQTGANRNFSAKPYIQWHKDHPHMEEHRHEFYQHPMLFEHLDQVFTRHFSSAQDGNELRARYKSKEVKQEYTNIIEAYCKDNPLSIEQASSFARNMAKMSARTYTKLNHPDGPEAGQEVLDKIHDSAEVSCDFSKNRFGPTLKDYEKKYGGDLKKMAEATSKYRSDENMSKMLNRIVDTSGKNQQPEQTQEETPTQGPRGPSL